MCDGDDNDVSGLFGALAMELLDAGLVVVFVVVVGGR